MGKNEKTQFSAIKKTKLIGNISEMLLKLNPEFRDLIIILDGVISILTNREYQLTKRD